MTDVLRATISIEVPLPDHPFDASSMIETVKLNMGVFMTEIGSLGGAADCRDVKIVAPRAKRGSAAEDAGLNLSPPVVDLSPPAQPPSPPQTASATLTVTADPKAIPRNDAGDDPLGIPEAFRRPVKPPAPNEGDAAA